MKKLTVYYTMPLWIPIWVSWNFRWAPSWNRFKYLVMFINAVFENRKLHVGIQTTFTHERREWDEQPSEVFHLSGSGMKVGLSPKGVGLLKDVLHKVISGPLDPPAPPPLTWCCCSRKRRCWVVWERTRTEDKKCHYSWGSNSQRWFRQRGTSFYSCMSPTGLNPPHLPLRELSLTLHTNSHHQHRIMEMSCCFENRFVFYVWCLTTRQHCTRANQRAGRRKTLWLHKQPLTSEPSPKQTFLWEWWRCSKQHPAFFLVDTKCAFSAAVLSLQRRMLLLNVETNDPLMVPEPEEGLMM